MPATHAAMATVDSQPSARSRPPIVKSHWGQPLHDMVPRAPRLVNGAGRDAVPPSRLDVRTAGLKLPEVSLSLFVRPSSPAIGEIF
jgi:hypothetical protein